MFGIEISTGMRLQIAFILLILGAAGYMLLQNSKKPVNDAVNSWIESHQFYAAGTRTAWDPQKEELWNVFTCWDGKLKIIEYKGDLTRKPAIIWEVDTRRAPAYIYYHDPMARPSKIKDPYKHAIALAAYSSAYGKNLGLMTKANLTQQQLAKEAAAHKVMTEDFDFINAQVAGGTLHSDLYGKALQVLAVYKNIKGDPAAQHATPQDKTKSQGAHSVIQTAADFTNKIEEDKSASVERYIATMNGILTPEQKILVTTAAKQYESGAAKPAAPARGTPRGNPAGRGTAVPNGRGGALPAPARGGTTRAGG